MAEAPKSEASGAKSKPAEDEIASTKPVSRSDALVRSGNYDVHVIQGVELEGDNLIITIQDINNTYRTQKVIKLTDNNLKILGLDRKALTKQALESRLKNGRFFTKKAGAESDFYEALATKNGILEFQYGEAATQKYVPVKPFRNYHEEKDFAGQYNMENGTGQELWADPYFSIRVEGDFEPVLTKFNESDFAYTSGWSCSGTPRNHGGPGAEFPRDDFSLSHFKTSQHPQAPGYSGYVTLRVDASSPKYIRFQSEVSKIKGVRIVETSSGASGFVSKRVTLIVQADPAVVVQNDVALYQAHMEGKWNQIYEILDGMLY